MVKRRMFGVGFLLLGLTLVGCGELQGLFHAQVEDTPAPTAMPLPTVTPSSPASTAPAPTEVSADTPAPTQVQTTPTAASSPTPVISPTRVVEPQEAIRLPPGFGISVFAQGLQGPRMMARGPGGVAIGMAPLEGGGAAIGMAPLEGDGALYVAERGAGRIVRLPDRDGDGLADDIEVVAEGLRAPSSIAFHADGSLYVGETTRVLRLSEPDAGGVFQVQQVVVDGLPGGGHSTRTVLFSPDGSFLFVSVGSSCNACLEEDERRATIMRYEPDGSAGEIYARGLRNAVGITFRPGTDELWATNNGRDWMGDDLPPETVYRVAEGDDAGWPRCHAGRIVDPDFGGSGACEGVAAPAVEMQAHSAPLGLTFYTGEQFPETYHGDMFVAFHGSWNRTVPTGYKVVHVPMENGEPGPVYDFAVGWLREDGSSWGRPVDVITGPDGSLFVSDDDGGRIYRIFYEGL